jgi:hypothetical protein
VTPITLLLRRELRIYQVTIIKYTKWPFLDRCSAHVRTDQNRLRGSRVRPKAVGPRAILTERDAMVPSIVTRVRPDRRVLGVVRTFISSDAVAVILPSLPSPDFGTHQEAPSSAPQRSLRHASASTESLPTSSPAEGRSRTLGRPPDGRFPRKALRRQRSSEHRRSRALWPAGSVRASAVCFRVLGFRT